ncbi:MAG: hypothetical protein AB7E31_15420 [Desulfitobacterium sp.]
MLKGRWCCFKGLATTFPVSKANNNESLQWNDPVERAKAADGQFKAYLECNCKVKK